jgi:hypothetical protein
MLRREFAKIRGELAAKTIAKRGAILSAPESGPAIRRVVRAVVAYKSTRPMIRGAREHMRDEVNPGPALKR